MNSIILAMDRDGFVGPIESGLPRSLLDQAAANLDLMIAGRTANPIYHRYSVRDYHLIDRSILDVLTCDAVIRHVGAVLGEDLLLWRSKVFSKPPGEGPLGWHQEWGAFNGEEIGNDRPALIPTADDDNGPWNLTVWLALDNVTPEMGPLRLARGSHRTRYPIAMEPLVKSEFYLDPFIGIDSVEELVGLARNDALVLDIPTAHYFDDLELAHMSIDEARLHVVACLQSEKGAVTLGFEESQNEIVSIPMPAGSFVMFYERTMHGSSSNDSDSRRLGINARFTSSATTVYPFRTGDSPIDGSNLDVTEHQCVLVAGRNCNPANRVVALEDLRARL